MYAKTLIQLSKKMSFPFYNNLVKDKNKQTLCCKAAKIEGTIMNYRDLNKSILVFLEIKLISLME
jgi:hypothetical protein